MSNAFPASILSKHVAVLGMTGSGKTSTTKLLIEQVVAEGSRVCILDPIKSDHWGLTSNRAGTGPGLPFQILGGPHGHVPLHAGAGAAIAELVATGKLPLSIIDMSDFPVGGLQHFFNDFAPMLMKKMRGVLYLPIEEAHELCPKEKSGVSGENMAVYHAKKLATAGRSKGIRLVVATQRVQALHNAVLGSCSTVIVHRMSMPADQEPVTKWLKGSIKDRELRQTIDDSIPELADGEGWMCSGVNKIVERVQFPRIRTFDNSATPEDDEHRTEVVTAKVDVEQLRKLIGEANAHAEENDPKALKARIVELERKLQFSKTDSGIVDRQRQADIVEARQTGERDGYQRGRNEWYQRNAQHVMDELRKSLGNVQRECTLEIERMEGVFKRTLDAANEANADSYARAPSQNFAKGKVVAYAIRNEPRPMRSNGSGSDLAPVQQRILNALAELEGMGAREPVRELLALLTDYTNPRSAGFVKALGTLSVAGMICYPTTGTVGLTDEGRAAANPPPRPRTTHELQERIVSLLGGVTARILKPLIDAYPDPLPRDQVAKVAGYENMRSAGFVKALGQLSVLGFARYPNRGEVAATPVLFLER